MNRARNISRAYVAHYAPGAPYPARRMTPVPIAPTSYPVTASAQRESMTALANEASEQQRQDAISRHPSSYVPAPTDFDSLTREQLRYEAKRLGIVGQGRMLKGDLLAAVKEAPLVAA